MIVKVLSTEGLTELIRIIKASFFKVSDTEQVVTIDKEQCSEIDSIGVSEVDLPQIVSSVDSSSTNDEAVGAKLFYDTCGDIETLINAL